MDKFHNDIHENWYSANVDETTVIFIWQKYTFSSVIHGTIIYIFDIVWAFEFRIKIPFVFLSVSLLFSKKVSSVIF